VRDDEGKLQQHLGVVYWDCGRLARHPSAKRSVPHVARRLRNPGLARPGKKNLPPGDGSGKRKKIPEPAPDNFPDWGLDNGT